MKCAKCEHELPKNAKFCPECGTAVPAETELKVKQEIKKVKGNVVGTALDDEALPSNLKSFTTQKVESVEKGGSMVGTVVGKNAQVGGQRQYGDRYAIEDITNSSNIAVGKNNRITFSQGASAEEIADAFSKILESLQKMPEGQKKESAVEAVQGLVDEAQKGEEADESKVQKWISFLGEMAPDIWEVAVPPTGSSTWVPRARFSTLPGPEPSVSPTPPPRPIPAPPHPARSPSRAPTRVTTPWPTGLATATRPG